MLIPRAADGALGAGSFLTSRALIWSICCARLCTAKGTGGRTLTTRLSLLEALLLIAAVAIVVAIACGRIR